MSMTLRFAPSPTGTLHVGGYRTALYNYLYARHHGGRFILRIEDTDRSREIEGAAEGLMNSLRAMGLDWDAGPGKDDGAGPYYQSQRLELYQREINTLLEKGDAYHCFCSSGRLNALRKEQEARGEAPGYDGQCRNLDPAESAKRAEKEDHVIRLKVPNEGDCRMNDLVRGEVVVAWDGVDDQVLIKSDGFPTYHFANVIDDHYMGVTQVIRGEEWLPSLPKHLRLYECFGWQVPQFAHLPLLLNEDRSKLSKRQGDVAIEDYLGKGYLAASLNNFLALLGWNPGDDREFFTLKELIEEFNIARVNKSGSVFDRTKLDWMNSRYIQEMDIPDFLEKCRQFADMSDLNEKRVDAAFLSLKTALNTFSELNEKLEIFRRDAADASDEEAVEILKDERMPLLFNAYLQALEGMEDLDAAGFIAVMKSIQKQYKKQGIKGKMLWMPVRLALTGEMHGPELPALAEYFGIEENRRRVKERLEKYF